MHFTRHSTYQTHDVPTIVRGDGAYVYDAHGKRYLDGLAGLFVVQAGHGRTELAEAAAKQAAELAFFPLWSYAHPGAIDLAARLADYAPGDLNRVFFTTGGGEAVESAWKLAKQYFKLTGKPTKHKVISRAIAYHGTPQGALSITGLPGMKAPFEPLVPSTFRVPNTNFYRAAETSYLGPDDERAFGRLGHMFAAERYGYQPDIVTCAKGLTSGYSPLGAMIATDRLFEPFSKGDTTFQHGYTFGGHPVSTAVAMANLDIFEREQLNEHVLETEGGFRATLEKLKDLPLVGDVRGDGYFYGIELVKDKATRETFTEEECERLLFGFVSKQLYAEGLYCRADDRGDPVVQLSPPLICTQEHFDEMEQILRVVLEKAWSML
ncbi:MAG TPA: aminotransferase class III-fold pyridoxal phosphate-dependent enzyme [Marmoricola sp.]|nr:aminotransferase class III-fold pyridoxal phosphate-dependent enzyme [Marmoricola sp.]